MGGCLAARMIILLREAHLSRFWPQFEAFLSYQVVRADGLAPGRQFNSAFDRHHLLAAHESVSGLTLERWKSELQNRWMFATVVDATDVLALPQLEVTSGKDKVQQIGKLIELHYDLAAAVSELLGHDITEIGKRGGTTCRW